MDDWRTGGEAGDWILEVNLRRFLVEAGYTLAYKFAESDWAAVAHGLEATDDNRDAWLEYAVGELTSGWRSQTRPQDPG